MEKDDLGAVGPTKPWYLSKGVIGSVVAVGAVVGGFFGVHVDPATQQVVADQATAFAAAGAALGGSLLAIYGRIVAKKTIG